MKPVLWLATRGGKVGTTRYIPQETFSPKAINLSLGWSDLLQILHIPAPFWFAVPCIFVLSGFFYFWAVGLFRSDKLLIYIKHGSVMYFCGTVFVCPQSPQYRGNDMLFWIFARSAVGRTVHDGIFAFSLDSVVIVISLASLLSSINAQKKNLANIQVSNDSVSSRLWKNLL